MEKTLCSRLVPNYNIIPLCLQLFNHVLPTGSILNQSELGLLLSVKMKDKMTRYQSPRYFNRSYILQWFIKASDLYNPVIYTGAQNSAISSIGLKIEILIFGVFFFNLTPASAFSKFSRIIPISVIALYLDYSRNFPQSKYRMNI